MTIARTIDLTADEAGCDVVFGFVPGKHTVRFPPGYLARVPHGAGMDAVLRACAGCGGRALLAANTAASGWRFIAEFAGLDCQALRSAIAGGAILRGGTES